MVRIRTKSAHKNIKDKKNKSNRNGQGKKENQVTDRG